MAQCMSSLFSFDLHFPLKVVLRAGAGALWLTQPSSSYRRPGILVLINDADWELEGEDKYELQDRDNVVFVSTLHGG